MRPRATRRRQRSSTGSTGPASAIESSQAGRRVLGPLDHGLVAERARRAQRVRRVGRRTRRRSRAGTRAGRRRAARSRAATPRRSRRTAARAAGARPPARATTCSKRRARVGQRELDRVLEDAGRAQCFFLRRFARARILYSRTRSCRSRWLRRSSSAVELALQLDVALPAVGGERAVGERRRGSRSPAPDRGAVGEAAAPRDLLDVAERLVEVGVPELQLADPRRVEDRHRPPGSRISSRRVVVWRPRWSSSRTSCVASSSSPTSALTIVDLPTPDEPSRTAVRFALEATRAARRGRRP